MIGIRGENEIPKWMRIWLSLLTGFVLFGCNLARTSPSTPTPIFPTPAVVQSTSTPAPSRESPTPAPSPTAPAPADVRINFTRGATADVEQGSLMPGASQGYLLRAGQTQPLMVEVDSPAHDVYLSVRGQSSGNVLLDASLKATSFEGILPATQDYLLVLYGGAAQENYTMTVTIPSRIDFAPGAYSADLSGSTPLGLIVSYAIYALQGQTMTLNLAVPANTAALTVYGFEDGEPLLRSVMNATSWSSTLPVTEDYIIQIVPASGGIIQYTLTVTVH